MGGNFRERERERAECEKWGKGNTNQEEVRWERASKREIKEKISAILYSHTQSMLKLNVAIKAINSSVLLILNKEAEFLCWLSHAGRHTHTRADIIIHFDSTIWSLQPLLGFTHSITHNVMNLRPTGIKWKPTQILTGHLKLGTPNNTGPESVSGASKHLCHLSNLAAGF